MTVLIIKLVEQSLILFGLCNILVFRTVRKHEILKFFRKFVEYAYIERFDGSFCYFVSKRVRTVVVILFLIFKRGIFAESYKLPIRVDVKLSAVVPGKPYLA